MIQKNLETIHTLALLEFKSRNERSFLGILWYLLNPILLFILLLLIFTLRLGQNILLYPLYLLLGIIMFNYFRQITLESTRIIENHRFIIKSTQLKPWILVAVSTYKFMLGHLFEIIAFGIALIFFGNTIFLIIWYIPILILFSLFIFGCSLCFMIINAYIADTENIWMFISQLLWFATPIFYAIEGQTRLFYVNMINPLYYFIELARDIIVYNKTSEWWIYIGSVGWTILALLFGCILYQRFYKKLSEMV